MHHVIDFVFIRFYCLMKIFILGSPFDGVLNGVSPFSTLFPLGAPFLSQTAASQLLGDASLQQSNSSAPSLLSAAGSASLGVPVTLGESIAKSIATASLGNNNGGESMSGD